MGLNMEDKKMKNFRTEKLNSLSLAALLMAGATFTACSSDDAATEQNPAQKTYTLSVNATKGGDATTRALSLEDKTLYATWATTENVYVKKVDTWATGSLQPEAAGATAKLKGSLSDIEINAADELTLQFPKRGDISYAGQVGTLEDIAANFDYATATVTVASVSALGNIVPTAATTTFENQQAIIKFMLKDKANDATISPSAFTVTDGTSTVSLTSIPASTYTANGDGVLYVAFPAAGSAKTVTLTATAGGKTYSYEKTGVSFTNGQYYDIAVKMSPIISLSGRTYLDDELVIADGYIVTGYAVSSSCKVAVADGATVTLRDVENDNGSLDPSSACPGIRCIGDATIILEGNNTVKGSGMYAGIYVPENKTLTIRGTGSLTVTGGSGGAGIGGNNSDANCGSIVISGGTVEATGGQYGAGIGLGYSSGSVGDITISGGTITATGGSGGAGIGLGYSSGSVGDITISGGTVTATGSDNAPGIGGPYASFQNITITDGVTKVTVIKGSGSTYSIGTSESDDMEYCGGSITIGGTVYFNDGSFENDGDSYLQYSPRVYQP